MTTRHYEVPPQLEDLLLEFTVNVLVNQPDNLVAYAVDYFTRLNESSNKYSGGNNKLAPADTNNVQDGAVSDQDDSMMSEDEGQSAVGELGRSGFPLPTHSYRCAHARCVTLLLMCIPITYPMLVTYLQDATSAFSFNKARISFLGCIE